MSDALREHLTRLRDALHRAIDGDFDDALQRLGPGEPGLTAEVGALSGALMAASRETLFRAGPFDEGYRLYGGAVEDRVRLRAHLDEIEGYRTIIGKATKKELQAMTLETLFEMWSAAV